MSYLWEEFLEEGKELFNYMTQNFDTMIDNNEIIKHFNITYGICDLKDHAKELNKNCGEEIQKELICWIKKELKEGRLFDNNNWKPFRDDIYIEYMHLGYKNIFEYKNYYLQPALDDWCGICKYCTADNDDNRIHFELALYGWKDDGRFKILQDNTLPEIFWRKT
jgi:hypothetical protein